MKKNKLFLTALVAMSVAAPRIMAADSTPVASYDEMTDGNTYIFTTNGKGVISYSTDKQRMSIVNDANIEDPNQGIVVMKLGDGKAYLYNAGTSKFINVSYNYAVVGNYPTQGNAWVIKNGTTAAYPIMIGTEDGNYANLSRDLIVNANSTANAGNQFAVYEAGTANATAMLAALQANIAAALTEDLPTGDTVGMYIADSLANARLALQNAPQTTINECITALEDYGVALKTAVKKVEAGKFYIMESAYVEFTNREKHMGIYTNGTLAAWKAIDENDPAFYFYAEKVSDGNAQLKFIIDGKYIASNGGVVSIVNGINYVAIGNYRYGLQPNGASNFMNPGGHAGGTATAGNIAIWGTSGSLSNEWYIKEVTMTLAAADSLLKCDIAKSFKTGKKIGSYNKNQVDQAKDDAIDALANQDRTVETVLAAHNAFLSAIDVAYNRPEVGKTYMLINAYEEFNNKQGVDKAAYMDGNTSGWNTLNETNPIFWWTVTAVEGDKVCFQNVAARKYLKHYVANNAYTSLTDRPFPFYCKDLGANVFSLYTYDEVAMSTNGPLHTNSHNGGAGVSGDWRCWGNDATLQDQWYIIEKSDANVVLVNYFVKRGDDTIMYRPTPAIVGEAYPVLDNSNPFGTLSGYPTEVVAAGGDVELTYSADFEVAKDVASITRWYALDVNPLTEKRPLAGVPAGTNIKAVTDTDDYRNGTVKSDDMMWAFVGNPFGFVKLYNKGTGLYAAKKQAGQKKMVTMEDVGDELVLMRPTAAATNGFAIRKYGDDVTLWNCQSNSLAGYDKLTDPASTLSIWEVNTGDFTYDVTLSEEYQTIILPSYTSIPDGIKVYSCVSVNDTLFALDADTSMIKANVPYVIKGTKGASYAFKSASAGNYSDPSTSGVLTGVHQDTLTPADSYVLQYKNGKLGFVKCTDLDIPAKSAYRQGSATDPDYIKIIPSTQYYGRQVTKDGFGTICLDKKISSMEGVEELFVPYYKTASTLICQAIGMDETVAGGEYIFKANADSVTFFMEGSAVNAAVQANNMFGWLSADTILSQDFIDEHAGFYLLNNNRVVAPLEESVLKQNRAMIDLANVSDTPASTSPKRVIGLGYGQLTGIMTPRKVSDNSGKMIVDGQLIITRDGVQYNSFGIRLK